MIETEPAQLPEPQNPIKVVCESPGYPEGFAVWREYCLRLRQENSFLSSILNHMKFILFRDNRLELGLPAGNFLEERISDPAIIGQIEKSFSRFNGSALDISLSISTIPESDFQYPSIEQVEQQERNLRMLAHRNDFIGNPLIKQLLETFECTLDKIEEVE